MALQNASRAKERRLEDLTRRALAGGQAEGSSSSSEEDEDAALAAKYLGRGGDGAGAGGGSAPGRTSPASDVDLDEQQKAASDAVKAAKAAHAARALVQGSTQVHGHLLGASVDQIIAELHEAEAFSMIEEDDLIHLAGTCARVGVPRGEAVMAQGDVAEGDGASMFAVVEGLLTVWITRGEPGDGDGEGLEQDVGTLRAGDVFGEQSLLLGKPRGATVVTGTECILLQITKEEMAPLLQQKPELTVHLAQLLAERTAQNARRPGRNANGGGGGGGGGAAAERSAQRRTVGQICTSYGIALARVRMEADGWSSGDDDEEEELAAAGGGGAAAGGLPTSLREVDGEAPATPSPVARRRGKTTDASAGRAARHAARLDKEIASVNEAREQYMSTLAAADSKRMARAQNGQGSAESAGPDSAEQERRRRNLERYESKLKHVGAQRRAALYELHRQLSANALTTHSGSGGKWVEAQHRIDPRINTHSIDEVRAPPTLRLPCKRSPSSGDSSCCVARQVFALVSKRQSPLTSRSASVPRQRPPPMPRASNSGGGGGGRRRSLSDGWHSFRSSLDGGAQALKGTVTGVGRGRKKGMVLHPEAAAAAGMADARLSVQEAME
eukprot:COSAG04_NODE_602_length_12195_cov_7.867560_6_plen_614_part_00